MIASCTAAWSQSHGQHLQIVLALHPLEDMPFPPPQLHQLFFHGLQDYLTFTWDKVQEQTKAQESELPLTEILSPRLQLEARAPLKSRHPWLWRMAIRMQRLPLGGPRGFGSQGVFGFAWGLGSLVQLLNRVWSLFPPRRSLRTCLDRYNSGSDS